MQLNSTRLEGGGLIHSQQLLQAVRVVQLSSVDLVHVEVDDELVDFHFVHTYLGLFVVSFHFLNSNP